MIRKSRLPWIMDTLAVIIIAAGAVGIYQATPYPSPPATPPACQAEDGGPYPCVWDGPTRGTPGAPGYRQGQRVTITERP